MIIITRRNYFSKAPFILLNTRDCVIWVSGCFLAVSKRCDSTVLCQVFIFFYFLSAWCHTWLFSVLFEKKKKKTCQSFIKSDGEEKKKSEAIFKSFVYYI